MGISPERNLRCLWVVKQLLLCHGSLCFPEVESHLAAVKMRPTTLESLARTASVFCRTCILLCSPPPRSEPKLLIPSSPSLLRGRLKISLKKRLVHFRGLSAFSPFPASAVSGSRRLCNLSEWVITDRSFAQMWNFSRFKGVEAHKMPGRKACCPLVPPLHGDIVFPAT